MCRNSNMTRTLNTTTTTTPSMRRQRQPRLRRLRASSKSTSVCGRLRSWSSYSSCLPRFRQPRKTTLFYLIFDERKEVSYSNEIHVSWYKFYVGCVFLEKLKVIKILSVDIIFPCPQNIFSNFRSTIYLRLTKYGLRYAHQDVSWLGEWIYFHRNVWWVHRWSRVSPENGGCWPGRAYDNGLVRKLTSHVVKIRYFRLTGELILKLWWYLWSWSNPVGPTEHHKRYIPPNYALSSRLVRLIPYVVTDFPESKYDHLKWSYENTLLDDGTCSLRRCIPDEFAEAITNPISNALDG